MNKYLVKIAEQTEKQHNLATRVAVPVATYYGSNYAIGNTLGRHYAKKVHSRADEYNHIVHTRTIPKMVRHNKLDVSLKGNPFGRKNKKHLDANFKGHQDAFVPDFQGKTKRDRVYATDKGSALHELGHATTYKKHGIKVPTSRGAGHLVSKYVPIAMIASGDREKAKYAPAVAAGGQAFILADEAMANHHARKALLKHQTPMHANRYLKRFIKPQMANYAAGAAVPIVGSALAYKLLYGKKKDKHAT